MNFFFIERYIQKITKEDIYNYAYNENINITSYELDIIYNYLKNNYKVFLRNKEIRPKILEELKSKLSNKTAGTIDILYNQYKDII